MKISDDVIACDLWFALPIKNPGYAHGNYALILVVKMAKIIIIIAIFFSLAQRSSTSLTLGTCNLQCSGQDGQEVGPTSSSIREQLRGHPGKMGATGLPGPIGPKGDPGASCDCQNEGDAFFYWLYTVV